MKKLLLTGLAVILITACQESKPERFTTNSPEIDSFKEFVNDYHNGDWDAWLGHYADTAKIYHNTRKNALSPQETMDGLKSIISNVSSYAFDESENQIFYEMVITDDGEKWVHFWGTWVCTFVANNESLEMPVHIAANFSEGKIVREYAFYNLAEFMDKLNEIEANKNVEVEVEQ